jgi:hypothetical protein
MEARLRRRRNAVYCRSGVLSDVYVSTKIGHPTFALFVAADAQYPGTLPNERLSTTVWDATLRALAPGGILMSGGGGADTMQIGPKKVVLTVVFAAVLAGFGPTRAQACSCAAPPPPLERVAAMAAVFEGYVLDTALAPGGGALVIHYQVLRAWKGVHADTVVTVTTGTDGGACGIPAELHTAYLVYAGMFQGELTAGLCFLSHRSDQDTGDFAAIGPATEVGTAAPGSLSSGAAPGSSGANAGGGCAIGGALPPAAVGSWWVGLAALVLTFRRKRQP